MAVREFQTTSGQADYVLFMDRVSVGVVEAKPEGTMLRGVFEQSARYMANFPEQISHVELPLTFSHESTGTEMLFVNLRDPVVLAEEIVQSLQSALVQFESIVKKASVVEL